MFGPDGLNQLAAVEVNDSPFQWLLAFDLAAVLERPIDRAAKEYPSTQRQDLRTPPEGDQILSVVLQELEPTYIDK